MPKVNILKEAKTVLLSEKEKLPSPRVLKMTMHMEVSAPLLLAHVMKQCDWSRAPVWSGWYMELGDCPLPTVLPGFQVDTSICRAGQHWGTLGTQQVPYCKKVLKLSGKCGALPGWTLTTEK